MSETGTRLEQPERISVRNLGPWQRSLFAVAGFCGLIAGGFAVFRTGNQAGSVALLAVGSVASLLAVVGKVPLKWVIGGNEFDMSETAARDAAEVVASQLTPSQTAELLGRLATSDGGRPSQMTLAMADHVTYEQSALARVAAASLAAGWRFVAAANDAPFDGYVETTQGMVVPIELKLVRSEHAWRRLRELLQRLRDQNASDVVLILGGMRIDRQSVQDRLDASAGPPVHLVYFEDPNFDREFVGAVERATARVR